MAHPSTEIRTQVKARLAALLAALPITVSEEEALPKIKSEIPIVNVTLGETSVAIACEAPREERRTVPIQIEILERQASGLAAAQALEAYIDTVERGLLETERLGLEYLERLEYAGYKWGKDSETDKVVAVAVLTFTATYYWVYPEVDGTTFEKIFGGIDHDADAQIETPIQVTIGG